MAHDWFWIMDNGFWVKARTYFLPFPVQSILCDFYHSRFKCALKLNAALAIYSTIILIYSTLTDYLTGWFVDSFYSI